MLYSLLPLNICSLQLGLFTRDSRRRRERTGVGLKPFIITHVQLSKRQPSRMVPSVSSGSNCLELCLGPTPYELGTLRHTADPSFTSVFFFFKKGIIRNLIHIILL